MQLDLILAKDIAGYVSVVLLAMLYIPQTFSVYYHQKPDGLTWIFLCIGLCLTIVSIIYGALLNEVPLIIANIISMICMILLLIAKKIFSPIKISEDKKLPV